MRVVVFCVTKIPCRVEILIAGRAWSICRNFRMSRCACLKSGENSPRWIEVRGLSSKLFEKNASERPKMWESSTQKFGAQNLPGPFLSLGPLGGSLLTTQGVRRRKLKMERSICAGDYISWVPNLHILVGVQHFCSQNPDSWSSRVTAPFAGVLERHLFDSSNSG